MLTSGLLLSGTQLQYLSALTAPGNSRSAMQKSLPQGPVTINMLAADCKMMHLHEKPTLDVRSKPILNSAASMISVYATRPMPVTRASADAINSVKAKKRSSSMHNKPLLEKRGNINAHARTSGETSPVRRFVPSNCGTTNIADKKATKVFLSQRQSSSVRDCGRLVPCAPPATPTPEHLKLHDYIPSLTDVKSQRHIRQRLESMNKQDQRKLDKQREEQARQEKISFKEKVAELKKRQRQEIYALNKVMTDLEYKNFEELVKTKGLNV